MLVRLSRAWRWRWNCPGPLEPGRVVLSVGVGVGARAVVSCCLFNIARLRLGLVKMPSAGQTTCHLHFQWVDSVDSRAMPASSRLQHPEPLTHGGHLISQYSRTNDVRHAQQQDAAD